MLTQGVFGGRRRILEFLTQRKIAYTLSIPRTQRITPRWCLGPIYRLLEEATSATTTFAHIRQRTLYPICTMIDENMGT